MLQIKAPASPLLLVLVSVAAMAFQGSLISRAQAQAARYPTKPVRLVVPYPPGGTTDLVGRLVAQYLGSKLGENFIVDNRGGASGQIGTDVVAKAAPDGYTLVVGGSGNIMMQSAFAPSLPYNIAKDFDTIGNIVDVANLMVVNPTSKITSLHSLVAFAKSNPGKVRYASGGSGSSGHVAGALLSAIAGIDMLHVPYRGGGLSILSVISGETEVNFVNLPTALPQTRSGKLRGVVILSTKRAAAAPEFPTTAEQGMPELIVTSSTGVLAPKGTPKQIISLLEKTLKSMAEDPDLAKQFINLGADVVYMNAAQYSAYIAHEIRRFSELGKRAIITIN